MTSTGLSRRTLLLSGSVVSASFLIAGAAAAALDATPKAAGTTATLGDVTVRGVEFKNNDIAMSGNLYMPKGFDEDRRYPAIVVVHPGGGVKEQVAGL